jgi:hypothetical protein
MKSTVRTVANDTNIAPKSNEKLSQNGTGIFFVFFMPLASMLAPFLHPKCTKKNVQNSNQNLVIVSKPLGFQIASIRAPPAA